MASLHGYFAAHGAIAAAAQAYCDAHSESLVDESDEEEIDPADFALALEVAVNDRCENLLGDIVVSDDDETYSDADALESIHANAGWRDYAADIREAIGRVRLVGIEDAEADRCQYHIIHNPTRSASAAFFAAEGARRRGESAGR